MGRLRARSRAGLGHTGKIPARIEIDKIGAGEFQACVGMGASSKWGRGDPGMVRQVNSRLVACALGSNPRAALGTAMVNLGEKIKSRSGAFRGY